VWDEHGEEREGMRVVKCPTCDRDVPWKPEQRWKPFCSERCKLIDLGAWADESHRIPGEPAQQPWHTPDHDDRE